MENLSIKDFCNQTASKEPVPGGGSVSALCGSLSGALTQMVAGLTIGKKKYIDVQEDMKKVAEQAESLRMELLADVERDAKSFNVVMEAFRLPKESDEEKIVRTEAIQAGLKLASQTPLEVAKKALEVEKLTAIIVEKGNSNALTDGLVATMISRTAVLGACLNIKINLDSIKDEAYVREMRKEVMELERQALMIESKVLGEYSL